MRRRRRDIGVRMAVGAAVAAALGAAGLAAVWLPARSAARVDPAVVLRGE